MVDWDKYTFSGLITRVENNSVYVFKIDPKTGIGKEEILDRKTLDGPDPEVGDEIWSPITSAKKEAKAATKNPPTKKKTIERTSTPEKKKPVKKAPVKRGKKA